MKKVMLLILVTAMAMGCNTKMGSEEPTNDSKANPAELPVDSVGSNTDSKASAASDSNRAGDPMMSKGKSDLQVGGDDGTDKAVSSDGNIVEENKSSTSK